MNQGKRIAPPRGVVELLRAFLVIFFALGGYQLGSVVRLGGDGGEHLVLGPFNGVVVGTFLGLAVGYVLGGVLGRTTITVASRTEAALRAISAEALVTGALGAILGGIVAASLAWPLFLLPSRSLAFPLYGFVVVAGGVVGFRLGAARREGVLSLLSGRGGLPHRERPVSSLPRVVDTSVAIDGRIIDIVRAGFLHGRMVVPSLVLGELQALSDSADPAKRAKGRRGLDNLETLRREPGIDLEVLDDPVPSVPEVDAKLVRICVDRTMALLTLDTNLARVAAISGVRVLNVHALTLALRPPVLTGDEVHVLLTKPGREGGQAVGYLDDGTMVVAERCRHRVGEDVVLRVTSVLTTANGRMVFAHPIDEAGEAPHPRESRA
ncbi:MAG: PilT protein domain protein [Frankiales bacterium]|nr:PilT protein domain protein [Frankiales bacterium]